MQRAAALKNILTGDGFDVISVFADSEARFTLILQLFSPRFKKFMVPIFFPSDRVATLSFYDPSGKKAFQSLAYF